MADKVLKTRIKMKTGTEAEWQLATNFVPLKGEFIVYDNEDGTAPRLKVGDGNTLVGELPFITSSGGSFLFQPEEPENAEDGVVWIDTDEENGTINYVSYDSQNRDEALKTQARDNIGAAFNGLITTMSVQEYESLNDETFVDLYNRGVRALHVENDGTFVDKEGIHYIDATLLATDWVNNKQTITNSYIEPTTSGELTLAKTITAEQVQAAAMGMLLITAQNEGNIEITSFGTVPEIDIPVVIRVVN